MHSYNTFLALMESVALSTTQQPLVEQSPHYTMLCLASMEQPTSSETQQAYMVELSPHYTMLCLTYMESATLSTVNLASNNGGAICSVINNTMTYKGIIHISHNKVERRFKLLNGDG